MDFWTLEDRLSQNVVKKLLLYAAVQISHEDVVMLAMVWFHVVGFRAIRFGVSYMNLRPHKFK